ncbi:MAG: hypothetical protein AABY22_21940 [Nanoarchaeota archaeon]
MKIINLKPETGGTTLDLTFKPALEAFALIGLAATLAPKLEMSTEKVIKQLSEAAYNEVPALFNTLFKGIVRVEN